MRHKLLTALAMVACLWATGAAADCTLDKIKACMLNDPAKAEQLLLHELANDRSPERLGQMAEFYRSAPTAFQDRSRYIWYLRRASNAGDPPSMIAFADLMIRGDGTIRDRDGAVKLLVLASKLGPPGPALAALGRYYLSINDDQRGLEALHQAAGYGDAGALALLAPLEPEKHAGPPPPAAPIVTPPKPILRPDPGLATLPPVAKACGDPSQSPVVAVASVAAVAATDAKPALNAAGQVFDPPSTLAGRELTLPQVLNFAYDGGFTTEDQLLAAVGLAMAESGMWTAARNWKPEQGYRDASAMIGIKGPSEVWSDDGRQMHSDRGIWQISSLWWADYADSIVDDPAQAAAVAFNVSGGGCDFTPWNSFTSGMAQKHYDEPFDGWPALRPVVRQFLATKASGAARLGKP